MSSEYLVMHTDLVAGAVRQILVRDLLVRCKRTRDQTQEIQTLHEPN